MHLQQQINPKNGILLHAYAFRSPYVEEHLGVQNCSCHCIPTECSSKSNCSNAKSTTNPQPLPKFKKKGLSDVAGKESYQSNVLHFNYLELRTVGDV